MQKKIKPITKAFKNHKVMVINENTLTHYNVMGLDTDIIETEELILPTDQAVKYYDQNNGGFTYIYNLDIPTQVELRNLKELRRNMAIKNIFAFDREKGLDIFKLLPWIVTIVALVF